ncbi:hypothetical protein N7493_006743 [Penicillium malachiteum]|uniref:Uncharacterized protein n=1 Tax=Penicillium malachiteum TaxID=1324776 RepID=A0AAD6HJ94_9EURO|nr:hypothetical protein N7493_006743 [Penicillium malachiteum]
MALFKRKLIISVDFGTTYSAISWLDTTQPAESELIVEWPGHPTEVSKVPSELRYASNPREYLPKWGYEIQTKLPRLQWIKLGLDPAGNKQLLHDLALKPRDQRRMDFPAMLLQKAPPPII